MDAIKTVALPQGILLPDSAWFDVPRTLDCGQAFRWEACDGAWYGVALGRSLRLRPLPRGLLLEDVTKDAYERLWRGYFDLDRDYASLVTRLCEDPILRRAATACPGIRIFRQEPWETLCSFILSQNNHIPRIKGIIARLCETFGEPADGGGYAFPSPQRLAELRIEELAPLRAGFRAKYLLDAARKVTDGTVRLSALSSLPLAQGQQMLQQISGVGPKVAACVLLYGAGRLDSCPVDVWMNRVLTEWYPQGLPPCTAGIEGFAQQLLFHYRRTVCPDGRLPDALPPAT